MWSTHCLVSSCFVMYTLILYSFIRKVWFYNEAFFRMIKLDESCCLSNFFIRFLLLYRSLCFIISSILKFFKLFFKNIWREKKIVLPLHSLLRTNVLDKLKKEFFEKIYINREVVQEARHIAICVLGRRNEPINSSNINEGFKE